MTVFITIDCCVCGKPVKIEIKGWSLISEGLSFRAFCSECIDKEPKKIEKVMYKGVEMDIRKSKD